MAMFLKVRLLVAVSSCMLSLGLRQKVMLPLSAQHRGGSQKKGQWARLDSALATASNRQAANNMAATARQAGSGVVRFDAYIELLVLSSGGSFPANYIYTYAVFENQAVMTAWTPLGDFQGREMEMQGGVDTMTQNEGAGEPHPIFFWVRVPAKDFDALKITFAKIVAPTRAEAGALRYDQACTISGDDAFCFENVWYKTLPESQDSHMSSAHMATFFGDTMGLVMTWGMSTLRLYHPGAGTIDYLKILGGTADNTGALAKLALVPECNYQGMGDAMYKVVDMKCCELATWTGVGLVEGDDNDVTFTAWDKTNNGIEYSCAVGDLGNLGGFPPFVRGYQACEDNKVVYAESCVPESLHGVEHGWPMSAEEAAKHWEHGTYESCLCEEKKLVGDQCFVGKTFPGMAFFGRSIGDVSCGGSPSNLPTSPPVSAPAPPPVSAPAPTPEDDLAAGLHSSRFFVPSIVLVLVALSPAA